MAAPPTEQGGGAKRPDKRIGSLVMGWRVEELIGWGASAKVYRARRPGTNRAVAIKIINKPRSRIGELRRAVNECTILSRLSHPNVVSLLDWEETDKRIFLIMELARNGDLLELSTAAYNKGEAIHPDRIRMWFAQLVDALHYAHTNGVAHKDIKPDNILLDGERIMLADWGYAHAYSPDSHYTIYNGTDGYWSPEIMHNKPHIGPEADCWSLGVTLYALACFRLPFDRTSTTYVQDLTRAQFGFPRSDTLVDDLKALVCGLLNPDPIARYTTADVLQHPYYLGGKTLAMALVVTPQLSPVSRTQSPSPASSSLNSSATLSTDSPSHIKRRRPSPALMTTTKLHDTSSTSLVSRVKLGLVRDQTEPPSEWSESSRRSSVATSDEADAAFETEEARANTLANASAAGIVQQPRPQSVSKPEILGSSSKENQPLGDVHAKVIAKDKKKHKEGKEKRASSSRHKKDKSSDGSKGSGSVRSPEDRASVGAAAAKSEQRASVASASRPKDNTERRKSAKTDQTEARPSSSTEISPVRDADGKPAAAAHTQPHEASTAQATAEAQAAESGAKQRKSFAPFRAVRSLFGSLFGGKK